MIEAPQIRDLQAARDRVLMRVPADILSRPVRLGLYGAGFLGAWAVAHMRQAGCAPLVCFDGNPQAQGMTFCGLAVEAPERMERAGLDLVLITARHHVGAVQAVLERYGVAGCSFDAWYAASHFALFMDVHDQFVDERSGETLRAVLMAMLTGEKTWLEAVHERDQYFCLPRFMGAEREIYVDAGAYVGDSIERFLWANAGVCRKILAFEPSPRQFAALEKRCRRLAEEWALPDETIALHRAGLGLQSGRVSGMTASGQLQSIALEPDDNGDMAVLSLDELMAGERVTFLKADVEGMEMQLLAGARHTIAGHRPKLAVCVYHYPSDIPEIMAYLRTLVPDYSFALRHHSPLLMETVLYCWAD
ncbi:MAG: FkbM family methyltransferase [Pseudochelatococcus sp.]|jgi:FkbM family methyltransferase|uniref:FkbM family methyltransferase n=1 Tax=Pseudochelatococcus sp. TaxID=2020869 RepID=UPI003D89E9B2